MISQISYSPFRGYLITIAIICYLFITETLGPQLWHIQSVTTGQSILLILYFIITFNPKYLSYKFNQVETLFFLTGCIAILIKILNGDTINIVKYYICTFLIPILLLISLKYTPIKYKRKIKIIIYLFYIIECSFAIFERIIEYSFFPFSFEGIDNFAEYQTLYQTGSEFRSCSLLGFPLTNALIVTTIYPFLLFDLKKKWQILSLTMLTLLALSSFNARGATLVFFTIFSIYYYNHWIKHNSHQWIYIVLFILICMAILLGFSQTEMAGRLFHGNKLMDGSAQTRLTVISKLNSLNFIDIFWGNPANEKLLSENGIINFIIQLGLPFLILYLYTYHRIIKYYLYKYSLVEKNMVILGSFGVAALNPSFTSHNYVTFLIICIAIFPIFKYDNHGSRINNHSPLQQRKRNL